MMEYKKISELAKQIRGVSYKPDDLHEHLDEDSVILLRANNISNGKINLDDVVYVDKRKVAFVQYLRHGDILVCASSGSKQLVGKAASFNLTQACTFGAFCKVVRPVSDMADYLGAYFQSEIYRRQITDVAIGANINNIRNEHIDNMILPIRTRYENQTIVDTIMNIQKIIDNRSHELEMLDTLVKARFIELFGKETEFDKWPCGTVGDVADVCVGVVIKPTQYYTDEGTPAFRSLNIGEMYVKNTDWVYFTEEGHRKNQKSVIRKNDVLVVRSGAPGTACVATEKYDGYNAVDIIIAHPDKNKVNSVFLAAFTNMPHGMNQIRVKTGGAAQQHFNVGGYKNMRLILPPMKLQEEFATFVQGVDKSKVITAVPFVFRFAPYSCRAVALCVCVHTCALASKLSCTCMSHPRTACRNTQIPFC